MENSALLNILSLGVLKLKNFIEKNYRKEENGRVQYKYIKIDTPTYDRLINYLYGASSPEYGVFGKIQKMYKKDYNNLRHTTIVAHGFEGINKEKIGDMLELNGINEDINKYFKTIKSEFFNIINKDEINIFNKLNDNIINNL